MFEVIIVLFLYACAFALQVFLASRKSKLVGLILPVIFAFFSISYVIMQLSPYTGSETDWHIALELLWFHGPTLVVIGIYAFVRWRMAVKQRAQAGIAKMNAQDL